MATDWTKLRLEYIHGSMTMRELAITHDIKSAGVMRRAAKEGWESSRKQESAKVSKVATDVLGEARVDDLVKFNEDDLKVARALRAQVASSISTAARKQEIIPAADLRALAAAAEASQRIGRLALGVSTTNSQLTGKDGKPLIPTTPHEFTDEQLAAVIAAGSGAAASGTQTG